MSDDPARGRFLFISFVRIFGVLLIMFGIVIASGRRPDVPVAVGYAMVIAGFVTISIVTRRLARRWRTPPEE